MNVFEKTRQTVKEVGGNVVDSAKKVGSTIYTASKEQTELAGMKVQRANIEKKLQESYAEIGKRYVQYTAEGTSEEAFDVADIMEAMQEDLGKLNELEEAISEKELLAKKAEEEKRRKKAQDEFDARKASLDKALGMDIISPEEYEDKLTKAQKKYDNYEQLRKYELQLQMGIISNEEYNEKVERLLS